MSPFYLVLLQEYSTTCSVNSVLQLVVDILWISRKCDKMSQAPGRSKAPPIPPFFDKHALKNLKVSLRVTIMCKNVIIGTPGGKIFKK